jgi:hypothetical protein
VEVWRSPFLGFEFPYRRRWSEGAIDSLVEGSELELGFVRVGDAVSLAWVRECGEVHSLDVDGGLVEGLDQAEDARPGLACEGHDLAADGVSDYF